MNFHFDGRKRGLGSGFKIYRIAKKFTPKIDISRLREKEHQTEYKKKLKEILTKKEECKCENIALSCREDAMETLGKTEKGKRYDNKEIEALSQEQKKLRLDIEANTDKNEKIKLKERRNKLINQIHKLAHKEEVDKINEKCEEIEKYQIDTNRTHQVIRQLQPKERKKIFIQAENGKTTNEEKQIKIITDYFTSVFKKDEEEDVEDIAPTEMETPFTKQENQKAV